MQSKKVFHTEGMFLSGRRLHFYHLWGKPVSVKGDNPAGKAEDLLWLVDMARYVDETAVLGTWNFQNLGTLN